MSRTLRTKQRACADKADKKPIRPINKKLPSLDFLTEDEIKAIHEASLEVLSKTGVIFALKEARDILQGAGALVEGDIVKFPRAVIEKALSSVPREFTLYGRGDKSEDMTLDGKFSYMNLDGNGMDIVDFDTHALRPTTLKDLEDATRLADWLPQISYVWPIATARDCPESSQPLHETLAQLKNTTKHIMTMTAANGHHARGVIEMSQYLALGADNLRKKPFISTFLCVTSPLAFESGACEAILAFARAHLPTGIMTMPISGATAPLSVAGNLVQVNAETLAGLALIQAVNPGCPSFYASCTTLMEMRTAGVTSNGPEDYQLQAGVASLARKMYDIPVMTGIMGTQASAANWQAGVEDALSCYTSALCGADLMPGAGLLGNATALCYEELIMACEIYEMIKATVEGPEISPQTLALEVIKKVGPRKDYMTEEHTLENMKKMWQPELIRGKKEVRELAREKAARILENHRPNYLSREQEEGLKAIIARY